MLNILRIYNINLIPRHLISQIIHRKYTVDEFYNENANNMQSNNVFNVILDGNNIIVGFLNYGLNTLEKEIYINIASIDNSHKCDKKTLEFIIDFFKDLSDKIKFDVIWHSYKTGLFLKKGFTEVKGSLLEYKSK